MKTMHLFAGIGGGLYADLIIGHTPIVVVEIDAYCCRVLRQRAAEGWFPGLHVWEGDVRMFDPSEFAGRVDCINAGFPCQDISTAGKGAGLDGERSGLFFEVIRIAGILRPRYIFLENVPAITVRGLGRILGALVEIGYDCRWTILSARDVGANHLRKRWWCLATDTDSNRRKIADISGVPRKEIPHIGRSGKGILDSEIIGCETCMEMDWGGRYRWWECDTSQSGVARVDNGIPNQKHRIKGLGNAQVPLQAALAWTILSKERPN